MHLIYLTAACYAKTLLYFRGNGCLITLHVHVVRLWLEDYCGRHAQCHKVTILQVVFAGHLKGDIGSKLQLIIQTEQVA